MKKKKNLMKIKALIMLKETRGDNLYCGLHKKLFCLDLKTKGKKGEFVKKNGQNRPDQKFWFRHKEKNLLRKTKAKHA